MLNFVNVDPEVDDKVENKAEDFNMTAFAVRFFVVLCNITTSL